MDVSVVIPCYNAAGTIAQQLEAIERQTLLPFEVIVVDNGSSDGSRAVAARFASRLPRFQLIDASAQRGAAYARNAGAAAASGDALAFCDADDEVDAGWLAGLARALEDHDFVASRFDRRLLNPSGWLAHPQEQGLIVDRDMRFLPHAGGCGLAIKRRIHEAVGGFDPSIRYHEDTDYCWRVQLAGVPLGFAPHALVHVRDRETGFEVFRQAWAWSVSQVALYRKYRELGAMKAPLRYVLKEWWMLLRLAALGARHREVRRRLAWQTGARLGRVWGSISLLTPFF